MILADTTIWIDHLRHGDTALAAALKAEKIVIHPFVIGELALGNLRPRDTVLAELHRLPLLMVADDDEVMHLIERGPLFGLGIGYVDAHLLAAARLAPGTTLWTRDKRLAAAAALLSLAAAISLPH